MNAIAPMPGKSERTEGVGSVTPRSALGTEERIFVDTFLSNGGNGAEAAIAAGVDPDKAAVQACRWLCRARIVDYLVEQSERLLQSAIPFAVKTLLQCCADEKALWKDRIKAATSILERGGFAAPAHGGVQVNVAVMNGTQAQAIISEVHSARAARLSDIPPAMSDTLQSDLRDIGETIDGELADTPGGDQLQGPGAGTCPLPASPSEYAPENDVSPGDAFRAAFDEDSQGEDDA